MSPPEVVLPDHHGVTILWGADVPVELRAIFRPYAEWVARFAPRWVQTLYIVMHDDLPSASLQVTVSPEYNRASIGVYMGFLAQSVPERQQDAAHELVHLYTAALDTYISHLRNSELPALSSLHARLFKQADESVTEALAALLVAHLPAVVL